VNSQQRFDADTKVKLRQAAIGPHPNLKQASTAILSKCSSLRYRGQAIGQTVNPLHKAQVLDLGAALAGRVRLADVLWRYSCHSSHQATNNREHE